METITLWSNNISSKPSILPQTKILDMENFIIGKALDLLGVPNTKFVRWGNKKTQRKQ